MSYIGKSPAVAALTSSDVANDIITLAKMAGGTDGNIITYDASGDPAVVATGSDGQVLTSTGAGSPPAFETISGGSLVKLQSQTASSASTLTFSSTYITSTYKVYELHCIDLLHSSDGGNISLQVSADNGSSYVTTGYKNLRFFSNETNGDNTLLTSSSSSTSSVAILGSGEGLGTSGNESGNSIITLFNPQGAKSKFFRCNGIQHNTSNQLSMQNFWFSLDQSATYNHIKVLPNTGTFSGTFILYGVTT